MTQRDLPLTGDLSHADKSATERVARLFLAHRGCWLTIPQLMTVGGMGAWRTEISRCRQQYGMQFANRITRGPGGRVLTSEYKLVAEGTWPVRMRRAA